MRDRVLVVFLVPRALRCFLDSRRRREVGKSLRQVHCPTLKRPPRHLADYGLGEQACLGGDISRHNSSAITRVRSQSSRERVRATTCSIGNMSRKKLPEYYG